MTAGTHHCQTRPPYFLYGAVALPLMILLFPICMDTLFSDHSGGHVGDYDLLGGLKVVACWLGGAFILGAFLSILSILTHESPVARIALAAYALPLILAAIFTLGVWLRNEFPLAPDAAQKFEPGR